MNLVLHVGIGYLRYVAHEKDKSENEDKSSNCSVHPLDVLQGLGVIECEKNVRSKYGRDNCSNTVESLGNVDSNLSKLRRAADYHIKSLASEYLL